MGAESKGWCEHIYKKDGNTFYTFDAGVSNKWNADCYNFQFCPLCSAPRPEKEKGLAEKLKGNTYWVYRGVCSYLSPHWEAVAQTAIDHAIEILETKIDHISDGKRSFVYVDKLKQALRESL